MKDFLSSLDWNSILITLWSAILLPIITKIGLTINDYLKSKKLDKYGNILYEEVKKAVISVYEGVVKDIKGSDEWTDEKKQEVRELAKTKTLQALSTIVYKALKEANVLSGGEKVRCMMANMMLEGGNVVLLDEPTNHLDLESITSLNKGMINFKGNMIFASHDQEIVETVANRIIDIVDENTFIDKQCTYEEYVGANN